MQIILRTLRHGITTMQRRDFLVLTLCDSMSKIDALKSGPVENIGIEPMTSCMPCKRSSQLS